MAIKKRKKATHKKGAAHKKPAKKIIKIKRKAAPKLKKRPIPPSAKPKKKKPEAGLVGTITHYFPHVRAAVTKLQAPLSIGDIIKIKGHTTDLKQAVSSMQLDHIVIENAKKGQEIGLMVESRVRRRDKIYKV